MWTWSELKNNVKPYLIVQYLGLLIAFYLCRLLGCPEYNNVGQIHCCLSVCCLLNHLFLSPPLSRSPSFSPPPASTHPEKGLKPTSGPARVYWWQSRRHNTQVSENLFQYTYSKSYYCSIQVWSNSSPVTALKEKIFSYYIHVVFSQGSRWDWFKNSKNLELWISEYIYKLIVYLLSVQRERVARFALCVKWMCEL